nr:hypothetical protein [Tanacetum cinerariifolium]
MFSQYDFVDTIEARQGLICSPGHDARIIAGAIDRAENVGFVIALQAFEHRMMTSLEETDRRDIRLEIDVVKGQRTAYETESLEDDSIDYLDEHEDDDEDPEEDPKEDHTDYPADEGDIDDEPSDDDDDDDDTNDEDEEPTEDEDDDEEEEDEHLALTYPSMVPVVDPVPSARDIEAFETDESAPTPRSPQTRVSFSQTCLRRARKTVRLEPPMSASMKARIAEHVAAPIPPTSPAYDQAPLVHRTAMIRMRDDIPEEDMPPRRRFVLTSPSSGCDVA